MDFSEKSWFYGFLLPLGSPYRAPVGPPQSWLTSELALQVPNWLCKLLAPGTRLGLGWLGWLGLAWLAWVWLAFLRISRFRLDFGFGLIWLDSALV